jgi:hypothetical protein
LACEPGQGRAELAITGKIRASRNIAAIDSQDIESQDIESQQ